MNGAEKTGAQWDGGLAISICIGTLPLMMALAPFSFSPELIGWQKIVLFYSLIVPLVQFVIVIIVMHEGGSVFSGWKSLHIISRIVLVSWFPLIIYTTLNIKNDHISSFFSIIHLFSTFLIFMSLIDRLSYEKDDFMQNIWFALSFGIILYYVVFILYIYINYSEDFEWKGPYPGFINIRHVSFLGFISFCAGMNIIIDLKYFKLANFKSFYAILSAILGLIIIFWTGSRGPVLAVLFFAISFFVFMPEARKSIVTFSLSTVFVAFLTASLLPLPADPMFGALAALGLTDIGSETIDEASSGRLEIWIATIKLIAEKPVLGWGLGQYLKFNPLGYGELAHPHNSLIQILFASGVLGFIFTFLVFIPIMYSRFDLDKSLSKRFHISMFTTLLIYSLYDGILYFSFPILMIIMSFIGCLKK